LSAAAIEVGAPRRFAESQALGRQEIEGAGDAAAIRIGIR